MGLRMLVRASLAAGFLLVAAHAAVALARPDVGAPTWLYVATSLIAAGLVCLRPALVAVDRPAWILIATGVVAWVAADIFWFVQVEPAGSGPIVSASDVLYLAAYGVLFAGLALLHRDRTSELGGMAWLDGILVGATAGAFLAALVLEPLRESYEGSAEILEAVIYPALGLIVLAVVAVRFSVTGWRPGRQLGVLGGGIVVAAVADVVYASQEAAGSYVELGVLDTAWPLAFLLVALAAWMPEDKASVVTEPSWHDGLFPAICAFASVGLLVAAGLTGSFGTITVVLAGAATLIAGLRASLDYNERLGLLRASRTEARSDALTGLPNRRALIEDLELVCAEEGPATLAFFDLDGFKTYNDTFGHAAGDALLQRLGHRLAEAVAGHGRAYRLGGDEFCALYSTAGADTLVVHARSALREHGDGFAITASVGSVAIPTDAPAPADALRLADQRMYARKAERREPVRRQARDLLLAVVRETEPDLDEHNGDVARLVQMVGVQLGLADDELDTVIRGAELHDVGKVAVPDEILHKPGPLTDDEWQLMRQHTIIGQRILAASPGMQSVGELVRASHERWDGDGYPDGLRGEEIPLGARIIAVCDSFDAMVSDRPYSQGRSVAAALDELNRCAGTQFDPQVVSAFAAVLAVAPERLAG
ncbi:MAG: diguanylate cyclase [Solirubrobacteraceae bacterium]|nr:diguanylate cyclase [Solirubrobacteraceae bacterium]